MDTQAYYSCLNGDHFWLLYYSYYVYIHVHVLTRKSLYCVLPQLYTLSDIIGIGYLGVPWLGYHPTAVACMYYACMCACALSHTVFMIRNVGLCLQVWIKGSLHCTSSCTCRLQSTCNCHVASLSLIISYLNELQFVALETITSPSNQHSKVLHHITCIQHLQCPPRVPSSAIIIQISKHLYYELLIGQPHPNGRLCVHECTPVASGVLGTVDVWW